MAVAKITKIRLVGLLEERDRIVSLLHRVSAVQIIDERTEGVADESDKIGYVQAQIDFAIALLEKYVDEKKPLGERLLPAKPEVSHDELAALETSSGYADTIAVLEKLQEELNAHETVIVRAREEREKLLGWEPLTIAPFDRAETETTITILGRAPHTAVATLTDTIAEHPLLHLDILAETEKEAFCTVTAAKEERTTLEKIIANHPFEQPAFPEGTPVPSDRIAELEASIPDHEQKIADVTASIQTFGDQLPMLRKLSDWFRWKDEQAAERGKALQTVQTFALTGWIDAAQLPMLSRDLAKTAPASSLEEVPLDKSEVPPVKLTNNRVIRPFEAVTGIYGMPQPSEVDPTAFLAPFFIVFFALCLTDAGYGIVLTVFAWLAIKVMKVPKENQRLFRVLIYGGIITFIIGALFGGWFGVVLQDMPDSWAWLRDPLLKIRLIDPVAEPITVLLLSFGLGIIQVLVGLIIDVYWKIRSGNALDGILSSGLWFLFLISILFWTFVKVGVLPETLATIAYWTVLGMVIVMIATQGRKAKNIILKVFSGVMSLYGLIGYMSDVLSYSRLLALGLATGIIASVVNLVATLFKGVPVIGWGIFVLALIGGHIFNLAINTLGAFIHSGRLQYVEFFPKFMEGGGKRFTPFAQTTKYVRLRSKDEPTNDSQPS